MLSVLHTTICKKNRSITSKSSCCWWTVCVYRWQIYAKTSLSMAFFQQLLRLRSWYIYYFSLLPEMFISLIIWKWMAWRRTYVPHWIYFIYNVTHHSSQKKEKKRTTILWRKEKCSFPCKKSAMQQMPCFSNTWDKWRFIKNETRQKKQQQPNHIEGAKMTVKCLYLIYLIGRQIENTN